mmetsp:Transcript_34328/g.91786  ORF Transcript_34328/g.91786 Transcript_34328/m.91786 type:complete len:225 (+) Transcript_34328:2080-2754(+)
MREVRQPARIHEVDIQNPLVPNYRSHGSLGCAVQHNVSCQLGHVPKRIQVMSLRALQDGHSMVSTVAPRNGISSVVKPEVGSSRPCSDVPVQNIACLGFWLQRCTDRPCSRAREASPVPVPHRIIASHGVQQPELSVGQLQSKSTSFNIPNVRRLPIQLDNVMRGTNGGCAVHEFSCHVGHATDQRRPPQRVVMLAEGHIRTDARVVNVIHLPHTAGQVLHSAK